MTFKAGQSGNPSGRKRGEPNKLTRTVKEAFQLAFDDLQSVKGARLADWARNNPTEFYKIAAKLIPADVNVAVTRSAREMSDDELASHIQRSVAGDSVAPTSAIEPAVVH